MDTQAVYTLKNICPFQESFWGNFWRIFGRFLKSIELPPRALLADPLYKPRYNLTLEEERELALQRLTRICREGLISVLDFKNNPLRIFAAHELAVIDPAMGTKMTVQFNLFGGTVLRLGTERHHYLLKVTGISYPLANRI